MELRVGRIWIGPPRPKKLLADPEGFRELVAARERLERREKLAEFVEERERWLRVVTVKGSHGDYGVALVIDGYYSDPEDAEWMADEFAKELGIPRGHHGEPASQTHTE